MPIPSQQPERPFWQTRIVNPLTALLFAICTALAIHRFQLFQVSYAPYLSFVIVVVSYLLLSQKYDPILSTLFFALALFLSYKTARYQPQMQTPITPEQTIKNELAVIASLIETHVLETGNLPQSLKELPLERVRHVPDQLNYCIMPNCPKTPESTDIRFWLSAAQRDKENRIWYLNDRFEIFQQTDAGGFEIVTP